MRSYFLSGLNLAILLTLIQKHQKKVKHNQRVAKEKIKKATSLANPLMGVDREIGTRCISKSARQEQQGLIYASQVRRKELHRFEPWPDEYSIRQVLRNQRSGILIASESSILHVIRTIADYGKVVIVVVNLLFRELHLCYGMSDLCVLIATQSMLSRL